MADSITLSEFKDALTRYDTVLESKARKAKPEATTLKELDQFRYIEAPAQFSKKNGKPMDLTTIQTLLEWKLRHGTFRPTLTRIVASNYPPKVLEATQTAFNHYSTHPDDIKVVIDHLSVLKGIGPATASLLLAVHDPENVIFFSDEVWAWLCNHGEKNGLKYKVQEFEDVYAKAKALASRLGVTPIEIEKAAFVIIREKEPVVEKKTPYQPNGRPRGRPKLEEHEKKTPYQPSGQPRGRPKLAEHEKKPKKGPSGLGRGRPRKPASDERVIQSPKPRGRPKKANDEGYGNQSLARKSIKREAEDDDEASQVAGTSKKFKF